MRERVAKAVAFVAVMMILPVLAYFAYSRPTYFSSLNYIRGLFMMECLAAAVWLYRRIFFPIVLVTFLLAGVALPMGSFWNMARWVILAVGGVVGSVIMLKERQHRFGSFHLLAGLAVVAAVVSAAVSRFTIVSSLKVLSLLLLFVYAATGVRLAVTGRENRFYWGLIVGCEVFVAVIASFYLLGIEVMGNPNSLGAVMGVVAAPILLWSTLLPQEAFSHRRRVLLYGVAMYLTFSSHARAGIAAAFISCSLLCVVLRRYRLLAQGIGILVIVSAIGAIVNPDAFSNTVSSFTSSVLYKGKDPAEGVLGSRTSTWQDTISTIHDHFWFGTGFGTSDNGQGSIPIGNFATTSATSAEHGSSYLAIVSWVGMLGVLPFFLLVGDLLRKVLRTIVWMSKTANPSHASVPLALLAIAGLIHAGFEDWLFAPGYYLCVFYWSMAFVLVDQVPSLDFADPHRFFFLRALAMRRDMRAAASTQ